MNNLRSLFYLRDDVVFLNHGSFGACPKPVMAEYQRKQVELERQPVEFLGRRFAGLMHESRKVLADYVGAAADDLVYVPNTTTGVNIVAHALKLEPGDEVLSTDLEYGAAERAWQWICRERGAVFVRQPVPLPLSTRDELVEAIWNGRTSRTKIMFLSHITSTTALILPVEQLIAKAREAGIITVIDGAHAPGQIPVDLSALDADFYTANCHKWMMAPKGSAFLYAKPDKQKLLSPLVISWGDLSQGDSRFVQENEWQGTRDIAAFLSVPAALKFRDDHNWPAVQKQCFDILTETRGRLEDITALPPLCPASDLWYRQMVSHPLPITDWAGLKEQLYQKHRVELPVVETNGNVYIRVSMQGYNSRADVDALMVALEDLLPGAS